MMKTFAFKTLLFTLIILSGSQAFSSQSEAARKAKGEVTIAVQAGGDLCQALGGFLEKSGNCTTDGLPDNLSIAVVKTDKKISVKEDQPVIMKAKDAGKTTGKVIQVIDIPSDMHALKEISKDRKCLTLWYVEKDRKLVVIQPDKPFLPEKGQQVKLKVKEVAKVEGC